MPESAPGESDVLSADDPEPIENGTIDVGRVVFESLSAVLDPFPRKEGAEFEAPKVANEGGSGRANPFAVLAKLKGGEG